SATKPEGRSVLGALHQPRRSLLSANQDTTSAALSPLRRQNPREEPGALAALAGIWAGGEEQSSSLPRPRTSLRQHATRASGELCVRFQWSTDPSSSYKSWRGLFCTA